MNINDTIYKAATTDSQATRKV